MANPLTFLFLALVLAIPVLIISGLIRLRLWGRRYLEENQRTRLELGKLAEEVAELRKRLAPTE